MYIFTYINCKFISTGFKDQDFQNISLYIYTSYKLNLRKWTTERWTKERRFEGLYVKIYIIFF